MIRIALISPKGPLYRRRGGVFKRSLRYAPLTLPTLARLIPPEIEHELTLVDEGVEDVPLDLEADLIGMTVLTGTAPRAYELAARFRSRGVPVVLGGPHVTLVPDDARGRADAIVVGYAEETWPGLLRDFVRGDLRARYDQDPDLSLAGRPFVDRNLMKRRGYVTTDVFEATRGCVHSCEFCVVPSAWGREPLQRPVEDVAEEIRRAGARRAIFVDLNIIADRDYALRLFEALVPLRVQWYGLATILLAEDEELLRLCSASGCRGLLVGLESIHGKSLREVRKGFSDPRRYRACIDAFHSRGIAIQGAFVFGFDSDTPRVFEETARFAIDARVDLPRFAILTPFPGTPLFDRLEREGRILTRDWELYDGQHAVFEPARMSAEALQAGTQAAWKAAYGFGAIVRRIRSSPAPLAVRVSANLAYRFYGRNLHRYYTCDWPVPRAGRPATPPGGRARLAPESGLP